MIYNTLAIFERASNLKQRVWPSWLSKLPTEAVVVIWVLGLWEWGNVLNMTSDSVDLIILAITLVPAAWLFWIQPVYGLVALMFFASGFLHPGFVDIRLPVGGGLEMRDMLLIMMFGLLFFQRLTRKNIVLPWWPVGGFMALFVGMIAFSTINALKYENVEFNWAFSEVRILIFYLIFFIAAWSIVDRHSLYIAFLGSCAIADITAGIVIIQQYLGPHNYLLESMHDGSWQVWEQQGATRVVPPGIVYMYFMMLISMGLMVFYRSDMRRFLFWTAHSGLLGISLLLTFTRSSWIASGITVLLMGVILFPLYRPYLAHIFVFGTATALFLGGTLGLFLEGQTVEIPMVEGLVSRFSSIFEPGDTLETNSLQWRVFELQEATKSIKQHPLIGVGLGNSYRNITVFQGEAQGLWTEGDISYRRIDRFTRYTHSSYLAITVKMGIPAIVTLLAFCVFAILKSWPLYQSLPDGFAKGIVLSAATAMIGLLQWSIFHAHLMLAGSTAVIGLIIGMLAGIHYIYVSGPNTAVELEHASAKNDYLLV